MAGGRGIRRGALALAAALALAPAEAVVNGRDAPELGRHAVMVLTDRGGFCTGSLVAPTVVMTAAHCVAGATGWRVHWRDTVGSPVMIEPAAVAVHPGYVPDAIAARRPSTDLALVRLKEPLPSPFSPAPLAAPDGLDASAKRSMAGEALTIAGYGLATEGDPKSGGRMRAARLPVIEPFGPSRMLVWLSAAPGRAGSGACQGDSGGPIFDASGAVVAVTVWAEGSGKTRGGCGGLTQGLLVAPQRGWIDATLKGWGVR